MRGLLFLYACRPAAFQFCSVSLARDCIGGEVRFVQSLRCCHVRVGVLVCGPSCFWLVLGGACGVGPVQQVLIPNDQPQGRRGPGQDQPGNSLGGLTQWVVPAWQEDHQSFSDL